MTRTRIHWIDIAKGILILCVFFGHTVSTPDVISVFIYYFHMSAFFLLSGYCFSNKRRIKDFFLNKLKSLVLPIFTLGLSGAVVVAVLMYFLKHESVDWIWLFLNPVVQCGEHGLLWYLAALFVDMFVFYALTKLTKERLILLNVISFVLGLGAFAFIKCFGFDIPWYIDTALVALPFISTGYSMKNSGDFEKTGKWYFAVIFFVICFAVGKLNSIWFGSPEMHTNNYGNILLFYVSAISGSLMVCSISMLIRKSRVLEYFGKNSLIFYALEPIQYFANFALKLVMPIFAGASVLIHFGISIVAVAFISAASTLASWIINKYLPFLIGQKIKKEKS